MIAVKTKRSQPMDLLRNRRGWRKKKPVRLSKKQMKELATITVSLSTVAILLVGGTAAYIIYGLSKSEHVHVPFFFVWQLG